MNFYTYNMQQPQRLPAQITQTTFPDRSMIIHTENRTDLELAEYGWYPVTVTNLPVPTGKYITGYTTPVQTGPSITCEAIYSDIPVQMQMSLTRLEFMNRFTDAELEGIYTAAKSSVAVEVWLDKFKVATEVNILDTRTIAGVNSLETVGLLATGRASEILA